MRSDLTSRNYWQKRQSKLKAPTDRGAIKDLLDSVEPLLREYKGQRWIELGCSPGHFSSLLYRRIPFKPFGVDFSPDAHLYVDAMAQYARAHATLFQADLRDFATTELYDVVMSFGLIEHFTNPAEILEHHYRLCRRGGLLVVSIPHLRFLQWTYHFLFDRKDLAVHNVSMMNLRTFHTFSQIKNMEILLLRHVGRINFWNVDESGPRAIAILRKVASLGIRVLVNLLLPNVLPRDNKIYAPWIVFVARKV